MKKSDVTLKTFTAGQAAKASGLPYSVLNYWAKTRFLVPSGQDANGTDTCRAYKFRDLVALRVACQLRDAGMPLQQLRKVVAYLQRRGYKQPLADAFLVVPGNGDIVEMDGATAISTLHQPGQTYLVFALNETVNQLMAVAAKLKPPERGKACAVA